MVDSGNYFLLSTVSIGSYTIKYKDVILLFSGINGFHYNMSNIYGAFNESK